MTAVCHINIIFSWTTIPLKKMNNSDISDKGVRYRYYSSSDVLFAIVATYPSRTSLKELETTPQIPY
jgi:hypothetical protein